MIKMQDNQVQKIIEMKISLARSQVKSGFRTKFFSWKKNTRLFLFYKNNSGKIIKEVFGVYMGDFTDNENITWIAFANRPVHFLLWFVPKTELIMCPQNDTIKIDKITDFEKNEYTSIEIKIQKIAVHYLDSEIYIETSYIDKVNPEFDLYIPVIKDTKGKIIDPTHALFQVTEHLVLKKVQYDILNSYVSNIRKGMDMNIIMRGKKKLQDSEGSVE